MILFLRVTLAILTVAFQHAMAVRHVPLGAADLDDNWEFLGHNVATAHSQGLQNDRRDPAATCTKFLPPSLVYLGMGHSGSTSLAVYMDQHPELSFGSMKEHRYMCKAGAQGDQKSRQVYNDEYIVNCTVNRTFDASPSYFAMPLGKSRCKDWHSELTDPVERAKTIEEVFGSAVLFIMMVRDPVDVLKSREGYSTHDELVEFNKPCESKALESWLSAFPRDRFLFLDSEDFFRSPQDTLNRVFEFAGVAPFTLQPITESDSGRRRSSRTVEPEVRRAFHQKPSNRKCKKDLEAMTGLTFHWAGDDE